MRDAAPLWQFLRAHKRRAFAVWLLLLLNNALGVLLPLSIGAFYGNVLDASGGKDRLLNALGIAVTSVSGFFALFAVLIGAQFITGYFANVNGGLLTERFASDLQTRLFSRQLHGSLATHAQKRTGSYLLRYSGDLRAIRELLKKGLLQATGDLLLLVFGTALMLWIDLRLGAVVLFGFALSAALVSALSKPMGVAGEERRDRRSRILAFVSSRLNAFQTVKAMNRETPEIAAFERLIGKAEDSSSRFERWNALLQAVVPLLFFATATAVMFLVALDNAAGVPIPAGEVLSFILLLLYMRSPVRRLLRASAIWHSGMSSLQKLIAVADRPIEQRTMEELPMEFKGDIRFENVWFGHRPDRQVLRAFTADLPAHALTHVVGPGGSGRTTLLALLQKFHEPQRGTITFDQVDVGQLSPFAVRKEVTIVSDDAPLLGDTVLKAISYSGRSENEQRAARVLKRLGIHLTGDLIGDLELRLDENAANLSRGQRRMLQFARAVLTRKTILLLDEPFNDLDSTDRARVVSVLNALRDEHTIVLVASDVPSDLIIDHTVELHPHEDHTNAFALPSPLHL